VAERGEAGQGFDVHGWLASPSAPRLSLLLSLLPRIHFEFVEGGPSNPLGVGHLSAHPSYGPEVQLAREKEVEMELILCQEIGA
jgi:hypothetical protein